MKEEWVPLSPRNDPLELGTGQIRGRSEKGASRLVCYVTKMNYGKLTHLSERR